MDKRAYLRARMDIKYRAEREIEQLDRKFAEANSIAEVGDVVFDEFGQIVVDEVIVGWMEDLKLPECVFVGRTVTRKFCEVAGGRRRGIYAINVNRVVRKADLPDETETEVEDTKEKGLNNHERTGEEV